MNKLAKIVMLSSAIFIPQVASATHAPPTGTLLGTNVYVEKGINFNCDLSVNINSSSSPNTATIALTPGNPLCSLLQFNYGPYNMTMASEHSEPTIAPEDVEEVHIVTIHGVDVSTISAGDCAGDITGEWDGTTLWIDTTLPAKTAGNDCIVIGTAQ